MAAMSIRTRTTAAALAAVALAAPPMLMARGVYDPRAEVRTLAAKSITRTSANLGAMVGPNGLAIRVVLRITRPAIRGTRTVTLGSAGAKVAVKTLRVKVKGLRPGTRYRVRAVAINRGGKQSLGNIVSIRTRG